MWNYSGDCLAEEQEQDLGFDSLRSKPAKSWIDEDLFLENPINKCAWLWWSFIPFM